MAMLACTTPRSQLLRTYDTIQNVPTFRDALALLRVWANQRGYSPYRDPRGSIAGFEGRGYFWAALLTILIVGEEPKSSRTSKQSRWRTVGKGLSSYQLFRASLDFLCKPSIRLFVTYPNIDLKQAMTSVQKLSSQRVELRYARTVFYFEYYSNPFFSSIH